MKKFSIVNLIFINITRFFLLAVMSASLIFAQSKSKIEGNVSDADTGEPLFGANIILLDTYLGAATNLEGKYFIVNVPVGTYKVQASMIGYNKQITIDVSVSADRITTLNFQLKSGVVLEEVIVVAKKNPLHKEN